MGTKILIYSILLPLLMFTSCCTCNNNVNYQLDAIIIPYVKLKSDNISLYIKQLEVASKNYDKNKKGVFFILDLDEKAKAKALSSDLILENVTLRVILDMICKIERFRYYIKGDSIVITTDVHKVEKKDKH